MGAFHGRGRRACLKLERTIPVRRTGGVWFNGRALCTFYESDQYRVPAMGRMPSASVNQVVTSPPYNLLKSSGNGMKNGSGGKWPKSALLFWQADAERGDSISHADYVA